ncbi:hypothetical protein CgunFtcFv8_008938 [Champsocephalus gunnari]|uniref:Uncharacterized protein n=1 Tax=Champsocephalus gunnari TaxID=52237 RepID=A0AAN8HJF2_CHAGU|nr:hypothetical protein CgunFtcFv8_008938 [Champsocephalus gunnari]
MEASMYDQPQVSTIPREMFIDDDDEEDVDDYTFRKHNRLKRDSGTSQTQGSLDSEDYEEIVTRKMGV